MVETATPRLRLLPPTVGGDYNTWGNTLNGDLSVLDDAITGQISIDLSNLTTLTLTTANGATDQARYAFIIFSGSNSAATTCTVTVPANQKLYWIRNSCTNTTITLECSSSGSTAVIPPNSLYYKVFCDGTNVVLLTLAGPSVTDWTSMQLVPASDAVAKFQPVGDYADKSSTAESLTTLNTAVTTAQTTANTANTAANNANTNASSRVLRAGDTSQNQVVTGYLTAEFGGMKWSFQSDGNVVLYDASNNVIFTVSASSIAWNGKGLASETDLPIDSSVRIQEFTVNVASLATVSFPVAFSGKPTCIIIIGRTNNGRAMACSYDSETTTSFVLQAQREDTDGASQQTTPWDFSIFAAGPK